MNIVKLPHIGIDLREFVASRIIKNCHLHCVCTIWFVCHVWDWGELDVFRAVFLNRRAAARYWALASIILGRKRFSWNLSF